MEEKKVRLLVIESDEDRVSIIKGTLEKNSFSITSAHNWEKGLNEILNNEYDIVLLSNRLSSTKNDVFWFLEKVEESDKKKLDLPFLISISPRDNLKKIEETLRGKKFKFIDKESINYIYNLEWAVANLVPKAFYLYTSNIKRALSFYKRTKIIVENIEKRSQDIEGIKDSVKKLIDENEMNSKVIIENQNEIGDLIEDKKNYVKWRDITESLGTLVGAFSLVIGIIISLILLLSKDLSDLSKLKIHPIQILSILFIISLIWGLMHFRYFKKKSTKMIEEEIEKFLKGRGKEIIKRRVAEVAAKQKKGESGMGIDKKESEVVDNRQLKKE